MSENSVGKPRLSGVRMIGYALLGVVGVIILLATLVIKFLTGGYGLSDVFKVFRKPAIDLSSNDNAHLISGCDPLVSTEKRDTDDAASLLDELVEDRDWIAVCDLIKEWDQTHRSTPSDIRYSYAVLPIIAKHFAIDWIEGNACHPEDVPVFEPGIVDQVAALADKHPDNYVLAAIYAYFLYCEAWFVRGTGWINDVKPEMVARASQNMTKARQLLAQHDPVKLQSNLLASVRFGLISIMDDGGRYLRQYYEEWAAIDTIGQRAQAHYARLLQPRWYGDIALFVDEARIAAIKAKEEIGLSRYATFFRSAINADYEVFIEVDLELLEEGLMDLAKVYNRSPEMVAVLYQEFMELASYGNPHGGLTFAMSDKKWKRIQEGVKAICYRLLREHLTGICPEAWEDGREGALWQISFAMEEDLKQGMRIEISEQGLLAVPIGSQ